MPLNSSITAHKLTAQATTVVGADLDNPSSSGGVIVVDITAITGTTPSLTVLVEGKDPLSGKYYTILQSAALTAVATTILRVFPSATASANVTANDVIPRTFRITATIAGTTPAVTATIGVLLNGD